MQKALARAFSDDVLRSNGILDLDPATPLHPTEAAVLLGTTVEGLEQVGWEGDLPPLRQAKPWASTRYLLCDVLGARISHHQVNDDALAKAHHDNLINHASFTHFLSAAKAGEKWPCVMVPVRHVDRPVELFSALNFPIEDRKFIRWLTLLEYVIALQSALQTEPMAALAEARQKATDLSGAALSSKDRERSRS